MSDPWPRFEVGTTEAFTRTYSSAPGSPVFFVAYVGSGNATPVFSAQATATSSFAFVANFTVNTEAFYGYQWTTSFAAGQDVVRGWFQGISREAP